MRRAVFLMIFVALGAARPAKRKTWPHVGPEADRFYQAIATTMWPTRGPLHCRVHGIQGYEFDISSAACDSRRALLTQQSVMSLRAGSVASLTYFEQNK